MTSSTISIRPGVRILSVLSHLNYKPWFAIAEFVDNALQSFIIYRKEIEKIEGKSIALKIEVELDNDRLIIRDNAAGIHEVDYARAFRPAAVPLDQTGLSEFGMGMKSAACWFAPKWTVRTSALGEEIERTITFDVAKIVHNDLEELAVYSRTVPANSHYTEIVLTNVHRLPKKKTISKIKTHLASIYRVFTQNGVLQLYYNGSLLSYSEPDILHAPPHYNTHSTEDRKWCKLIDFDFGEDLKVHGFAAIRETGSTANAGFALFRRNRLIQGSGDETYRPKHIFKASNSFTYQRVFGELHLEGFKVSHTKDGFQWDEEDEEAFLDLLKEHLDLEPMPLLRQAEAYRTREKSKNLKTGAETSTQRTADSIKQNTPPIIEKQLTETPLETLPLLAFLPSQIPIANKKISVKIFEEIWEISLELSNDPGIGDWVSYVEEEKNNNIRQITIRVTLAHPFMVQFSGIEASQIEPLHRMAVAIVLAEITARESGVRSANIFRKNINEFLRDALSNP